MEHSISHPMPAVSVVSPVYGSEETLPDLCHRLRHALSSMGVSYEVILVFDCSPDQGWERIVEECARDPAVVGVKLSRNFGQHYAITAGLAQARGEWVVVMDCDLQDRPEEIPRFYEKAREGYEVVVGQRAELQDSFGKRLSSRLFHRAFRLLSGIETDASVANFGIYSRKVIQAVLSMNEPYRLFPLLVLWLGFTRTELEVEHSQRAAGDSGYSFKSLCRLAADAILSFSNRPLHLTVVFGAAVSLLTALAGATYFGMALQGVFAVSGYASLILSIWFLSGVIIFFLGVVAIYVGRHFTMTKGRPLYVVEQVVRSNADSEN